MLYKNSIIWFVCLGFCALLGKTVQGQCGESELIASDFSAFDRLGTSTALFGSFVVCGSPFQDELAVNAGAAYVFVRDKSGTPGDPTDDVWIQLAKLTSFDAAQEDLFGFSVCGTEDTLFIGAPRDDDSGSNSGSVYVLKRDINGTPGNPLDDSWNQAAKLLSSDAAPEDFFGHCLALDADTLVVGAPGNDDTGSNSGCAYLFRRDDNGTPADLTDDVWLEQFKVVASDAMAEDSFGHCASVSGDVAVIGAPLNDELAFDAGAAYAYRRDDAGTPSDPTDDLWLEMSKITASDGVGLDLFGSSVCADQETLAIGAPMDLDSGVVSGTVYIVHRDDNATPLDLSDDTFLELTKVQGINPAQGDSFGKSIDLLGSLLAIGAPGRDKDVTLVDSGAAYLFERDDQGTPSDPLDDSWSEQVVFFDSGPIPSAAFGSAVDLSSEIIAIGAPVDGAAPLSAGSVTVSPLGGVPATWANYGTGWPGTNGVPTLAPMSDPAIGTTISVNISNSFGIPTQGFLMIGFAEACIPTGLDGKLYVLLCCFIPVPIFSGGTSFPADIPSDCNLISTVAYLQAMMLDPGASKGVSFTQGLALSFGL